MTGLREDVRFGIRLLLRHPTFTVTAIAALGLGIGATSATYSVIYDVLLRPLPYYQPGRLVQAYENNPAERFERFPFSPADFLDYRKQNRVFESMATYVRQDQQYGGERPERLIGARVSYGFFHLFGAAPALGRVFTMEEEKGTGATDVVILSYAAWKRLLNCDPHVIGRTIRLSDYPFRIVGIMQPQFEHISGGYRLPQGEAVDVWLPFDMLGNPRGVSRAFHYCNVFARLKSGVSPGQAQSELDLIAARLESQYRDDLHWRVQIRRLQDDQVGSAKAVLLILAGAVAFVLLICCVNVANLLLARATARQREMAIRTAVGATRARLARQMLTESGLLASAGGVMGLLLSSWGVHMLVAIGPRQVPRLQAISLDAHVVVITAGIATLSLLLFGLLPALTAFQDLRGTRPRSSFVVAEVALSSVLLLAAGLLLRSFVALDHIDPGFNARGVLTMNTALSYPKLTGARRYAAFYEHFVEALSQLPGVTAAGAASDLPWTGLDNSALFGIEGRPRLAGQAMHAHYQSVSPDYLRAIGVPLLAGRWLATSDHFDATKVALINRTFALTYWPTVQACLGQRIYAMRDAQTVGPSMTVVGVVGDVKDAPTDLKAMPAYYEPFLQSPSFGSYVALKSTTDFGALIPAVRQAALEMGNDFSIQEIRPMEQIVSAAVSTQRFAVEIIGLFAVVALVLALIGVYGVVSYAAGSRAREIAIRAALGARPIDNLRMLLAQALQSIVAGVAIGGMGALGLTRLLSGILYQVTPTDPLTFAAVPLFVAMAAFGACLAPVRAALRIDPMDALRELT